MIKDDNYVSIQGWMITRLGLTGNDLLVYAVIYGFSQDGITNYTGTRAYLAEWCRSSERAISRNIKNLVDKGLIKQVYKSADCHDVHYCVTDTRDIMSGVPLTKCQGGSDKMSGVPVTICQGARDNMSGVYIDNIEDNLTDNIADNIVVCEDKPKRFVKPSLEEVKQYAERNGKSVVDPVRFYDYYTANGWKVGKNPMKDWKAAFRMWEGKEKAEKPASPNKKEIKTMNETHVEEMTGKWDGKSVLQPWERQRLSPEERQRYDFWHLMKED